MISSLRGTEEMPTVWFTLRRSLHCWTEPSEVQDPIGRTTAAHRRTISDKWAGWRVCSRSIANIGVATVYRKRGGPEGESSPISISSGEFMNPFSHEVIVCDTKCELRITGFGTLCPGTPGPGGALHNGFLYKSSSLRESSRSTASTPPRFGSASPFLDGIDRGGGGFDGPAICHRCGVKLERVEAMEGHHLSRHAVTALVEGDSSRKIVEIICKANLLKPEKLCGRIERVLKVHNTQRALAEFEEYREAVKTKAGKLPKKHPRCLADGNELLRFHGTKISCLLGLNGASGLCRSVKCGVCSIVRHGFSKAEERNGNPGGMGVFTASDSERALEGDDNDDDPNAKKALLVCRVIAGRVHKPLDEESQVHEPSFDSFASNMEELYLLNPQALLPCFAVIFKA